MRFIIAHAAWLPERRRTLERLLEQLGPCRREVLCSRGREHAAIWARRVWEEAARARYDDDHVCILNDDVILQPDFHARLRRLVEAVPDEPISLHCTNPLAIPFAAAGLPWVRCYHYTGPAVVLSPGDAVSLCEFIYRLPWSLLSRTNEDNIACMWAWDRQRPFWYALPAPVTHDTDVPSSLGYDNHPNRVPVALGGPEPDWTVRDKWRVPFVELSWMTTPYLKFTRQILRDGGQLCAWCLGTSHDSRAVGKQDTTVCMRCLQTAARFATQQVNE